MAVLPLFLSQHLGLTQSDIVLLGSYFFLLPFLLEVPLGLLADLYGNKPIIYTGLTFFLLGFVCLLCFSPYIAYSSYLFCIVVAAACFSGAESSFLLSILPEKANLFTVQSEVAAFTYTITSFLIFLGGVLFYIHPIVPIIFQIISLFIAIVIFFKLSSGIELGSKHKNSTFFQLITSSYTELKNIYVMAIIFLIAIAGFAVMVNNRTVSIAFADLLPIKPEILVAIIFIIGNFMSAASNQFFKKSFPKFQTPVWPILIIGGLAVSSFFLMSIPKIVALFIGFLVLCIFKSAYRAYLNSLLIHSLKDSKIVATILSLSAIISALVSFLFSFLYGHAFSSFAMANLWMAVLMGIFFVFAAVIIFFNKEEITWIEPENAQSSKKHFIKRYHQTFSYGQIYPTSDLINEYLKNGSYLDTLYPAPKMLSLQGKQIIWEFLKGCTLSEADIAQQKQVIYKIKDLFKARIEKKIALAHGDLHPDNIMVVDTNKFYVIDWDLCKEAEPEHDILTFFTSPRLHLNPEERITFISDLLSCSVREAQQKLSLFLAHKIKQLKKYDNPFMHNLVADYEHLNGTINAGQFNNM